MHKQPEIIGIPRALWYYIHPGLWEDFFVRLGLRVEVSSGTVRNTVERAGLISESEHCLPVKIHDAHLAELAERVDLIFVPRVYSTLPGHIACPKLGALPDCAIADFTGQADFVTLDINEARIPLRKSMVQLGRKLNFSRRASSEAAGKAWLKMRQRRRKEQVDFQVSGGVKRILLLAHPYNLLDQYLAGPVISKLKSLEVECCLVDHSRTDIASGPIKWDTCSIMYDTLQKLHPSAWAGVVQLSSFNCGCDSVAMEIFQTVLREKEIPYMRLILDEYDGQAGLDTRLEAFVDSIGW